MENSPDAERGIVTQNLQKALFFFEETPILGPIRADQSRI